MPETRDDLLNELTPAEWRLVVSLVEAIATSDEGQCPVCGRQIDRISLAEHIGACRDWPLVRTRRLEVLDGDGRVAAVVGELQHPPAARTVGLALLDALGHERAVLALDHDGPKLELTSADRNTAALFGVDDPSTEVEAGTYLLLLDASGNPVQGWRVTPTGQVVVHPAGQAGEDR